MNPPISILRAALSKMHARACGDASMVYMSVPAEPNRDADLLLSAALDELEALRLQVEVSTMALNHSNATRDKLRRDIVVQTAQRVLAAFVAAGHTPNASGVFEAVSAGHALVNALEADQ